MEPTREESTETEAAKKQQEQEGLNIKYQEELCIFLDKKAVLDRGLKKTFAYIFSSFCAKTMQQCIEEHPDFGTFRDDPIELLKVIKLLMHDPVRT